MAEIKAPEGGRRSSEMQKRIARAIEDASKDCDDPDVYYQVIALAAMKAMREPTLMMCRAMPPLPAIHVVDDLPLRNAGWRMGEIQNLKRWRAAIDAEISIAEGGKDG